MLERWKNGVSLKEMAMLNVSSFLENDKIKNGFHYPVSISLRGKSIAGYFINHHIAHAASCYYSSGFQDSAIITHDGFGNGFSYHSGLYYMVRIITYTLYHLIIFYWYII